MTDIQLRIIRRIAADTPDDDPVGDQYRAFLKGGGMTRFDYTHAEIVRLAKSESYFTTGHFIRD